MPWRMLRMVLTDKRPITPARKIDNDKDGEMKLTVGLALTPRWRFAMPPASCRAMTWTWPAISGARWG